MLMRTLPILAAAALLPLASAAAEEGERAEEHYHLRAAPEGEAPKPWVIVLPGGGGIEVFGDKHFYFDEAQRWNEAGFDALVVHYQAAAPLVPGAEGPAPGPMEARVVADALQAAERNDWLDLQCPGFVIGFSMGGAGALMLAADPPANLVGAIGRYPLVRGMGEGYRPQVPVLILQGEADELTTMADLDAFLASANDETGLMTVHRYPEAEHGFDIPSLATPVEYNGGTFRYQQAGAEAAVQETAAFARKLLADAPADPACKAKQEG
jgi:dienelactone hydrolase